MTDCLCLLVHRSDIRASKRWEDGGGGFRRPVGVRRKPERDRIVVRSRSNGGTTVVGVKCFQFWGRRPPRNLEMTYICVLRDTLLCKSEREESGGEMLTAVDVVHSAAVRVVRPVHLLI